MIVLRVFFFSLRVRLMYKPLIQSMGEIKEQIVFINDSFIIVIAEKE